MSKPTIRVYLAENEFVDREMNAEEFAQYKIDQAELKVKQDEVDAKVQAKAELLAKLGITAEEAVLLLS
jgi:hypothetical protein